MTQDAQSKQDTTQLLVPKSRREMLFQAAHCNPMAGHLGQAATLNRLMARFFWPGIHENVRRWCAACRECQLVNPPASPKAPLRPLPLMQVPFERIGMDLIGPLERSARGHRFALVLVDYATRYPEAVALRNISAKSVAEALFSMISRVGIPKEILTDQGTAFMSRTIRELYELLGIKSIRTSVYHPQTDGLVERFNRTLKTMIALSCPRPKTKKEVRQFLGLAGYYRRFVPDYSELTSPLTDLTKKEVPDTVPWTERCQQVFTQVKAALCGGPLLHSPDFSLPFLLQTDASDRGLGAVLTQEIGGEERPVLYISRKLSKRETMYSTIEKECLAIRWAVLTLRYYLLGREFTLCSDHAPLQWLHRMKDTNARITRWYLALQPFKFKVIHRPGTQMTVADFLSSRAVGVCGEGGVVQRSLQREKDSGDSGK